MGKVKPVESENVAGYEYDAGSLVLILQFKDGAVYEYTGVPADFAAEFDLPHPWHRVHARIKAFPYRRIS